ncbi:putative late blight resistance protein R1A-10 [Salvia divinorum]|uniref:Late blight resistance protein R1A-10 n=1 Tax=Salvia divinorum TaxID=28513 RepID=A0ABD1GZI2_SALDI
MAYSLQQTLWIVDRNKPQLQSLLEKAESLLHILENSSLTNIPSLESRIRDVSYKADDIIETRMVRQMLSTHQGTKLT